MDFIIMLPFVLILYLLLCSGQLRKFFRVFQIVKRNLKRNATEERWCFCEVYCSFRYQFYYITTRCSRNKTTSPPGSFKQKLYLNVQFTQNELSHLLQDGNRFVFTKLTFHYFQFYFFLLRAGGSAPSEADDLTLFVSQMAIPYVVHYL